MGLAGRKVKQRIPADPRNLAWADDAARFGSNYLAKFGWDASKGLGVDGEGRTSYVKVSQKLDMLGIGAAHQRDPNGIAWKQNKDFESLLKRLNATHDEDQLAPSNTIQGFKKETPPKASDEDGSATKEKARKRKKEQQVTSTDTLRKKKKTDEGASLQVRENDTTGLEGDSQTSGLKALKPFVHRAHRAKLIASKSLASKSSAAIAQILGVTSVTPMSGFQSENQPDSQPSREEFTPTDSDAATFHNLTTSSKSVADYFREKTLAEPKACPLAKYTRDHEHNDAYNVPRGGLGSSRLQHDVILGRPDIESSRLERHESSLSTSFKVSSTIDLTFSIPASIQDTQSTIPSLYREFQQAEHISSEKQGERESSDKKKRKKKHKRNDELFVDRTVTTQPNDRTPDIERSSSQREKKGDRKDKRHKQADTNNMDTARDFPKPQEDGTKKRRRRSRIEGDK